MDEIADKISKVERLHDDPANAGVIEEWRERLRKSFEMDEYLDNPKTKELVAHLVRRTKEIRTKLSTVPGMEKVDNLALHARLDEVAMLLGLLAKDPDRERKSIEEELEEYL